MIIPSIDLQNGRAVQLRQGRDLLLESDRDPVELAREFGRFGPVAVIDLDAALGRGDNKELIARCCEVAACRVGGGLRDAESIRDAIRQGASQVIVGTAAEPELLRQFAPEQLIVALDTRGDTVLSHGWTESTEGLLIERGRTLAPYCAEFLFTQVEREGMLAGVDLDRARELASVTNRPVTVAGGIRDSEEVASLQREGFNTQIGRALYEGSIDLVQSWIRSIQFDDRGLVPTIVQDASTNAVLMLAYSNTASLTKALTQGAGWYWSRSRGMLWEKGAISGNRQRLVRADFDCDRDTLLFQVEQTGPACHRGTSRCFGVEERAVLPRLSEVIEQRKSVEATESYSKKLLDDPTLVAEKLREETEEVIEATEKNHIAWECADLLYHLMVRASAAGVRWERVESELRSRF